MPAWKEDFFSLYGKQRFFYRSCFPDKPAGLVLLLHGYAEHSGRYRHVMEYLAARGYASAAPDLRGHGRTARHLGDLNSFQCALDDLTAFKKHLLENRHREPFFILGHSLGGCFSLCLSALHPAGITGTVAIAPTILIPDYASPLLVAVSGVLAAFLPWLPVQPFSMEDTCRDPQVLEAARQDPFYYRGKMMARTGYQILRGISLARSLLSQVTVPLLLLHGGEDRVMEPEGSQYVLDAAGSTGKTLKDFPGLYHEILNEPEKEKPLAVIGDWLDAHRVT